MIAPTTPVTTTAATRPPQKPSAAPRELATTTVTNAAIMYSEPCAMLMTRSAPKTRERPAATMNRYAALDSPPTPNSRSCDALMAARSLRLPGRAEREVGGLRVASLLALAVPQLVHQGRRHHDVVALQVRGLREGGEGELPGAVGRRADRLADVGLLVALADREVVAAHAGERVADQLLHDLVAVEAARRVGGLGP